MKRVFPYELPIGLFISASPFLHRVEFVRTGTTAENYYIPLSCDPEFVTHYGLSRVTGSDMPKQYRNCSRPFY